MSHSNGSFIPALIIGAGQAGLAMSRMLTERAIDHVIVERGQVANSWRTERWDSLRLLTPNWQSRLPGFTYDGDDPDGYMDMRQVIGLLDDYAASFQAPVHTDTTVKAVRPMGGGRPGYEVRTDRGRWYARTVVIATGACSTPAVPEVAANLPADIHQLAPIQYRNPDRLPDGGVLVVGASASGIQIADELQRAGRDVTLAVGRHIRLPRTYRGMDVQWWLDGSGILDRRWDEVDDIEEARTAPSLQIVGTPEHRSLDLDVLQRAGVALAGRLVDIDGTAVRFADDLADSCARADHTLGRMLDLFDDYATEIGIDRELSAPVRPDPVQISDPALRVDLREAGITTVLWATGFRPHFPWLHAPVFDDKGDIRHDGGVVQGAEGLYLLGQPFLRRRRSTFIDGAGDDARDLAQHLTAHLDRVSLVI